MSASMVEKVARAIVAVRFQSEFAVGEQELLQLVDDVWEQYEPHARAAIEVMREPTEAMIRAGSGTMLAPEGSEFHQATKDLWNNAVRDWQDMIDKALSE